MRRPVSAFCVVVFAALACLTAPAQAHTVAKETGKPSAAVMRYWTVERMRSAIPAERRLPLGKPSKPGDGATSGASAEVPLPYPSAHGKVFFTDGTTNYVCSGTAVSSVNQSVVWTAGHCVNEGPGGFFTNFLFVPAYRDGAAPHGTFAASALLTTSGWQQSGEWGVDLGAAVVGSNSSGQTLSEAVAERALAFDGPRVQSYKLYGYPAAKKFSGQRMRVCNTSWLIDDSALPPTMGVSCDMTGGSSGGGWVTASNTVASVVSYGYASLRNVLFGPYQAAAARQLHLDAQAR